jgi:hypothetical protein
MKQTKIWMIKMIFFRLSEICNIFLLNMIKCHIFSLAEYPLNLQYSTAKLFDDVLNQDKAILYFGSLITLKYFI